MTAKDYLTQYREIVMEIEGIERSIESLREQATSVALDTSNERVQSSGDKDKVGSLACEISDLSNQKKILSLKLAELSKTINKISDSKYRTLLRYRYIALYSWDKIAKAMGYETRYVLKLHGQALVEVEKVLENRH